MELIRLAWIIMTLIAAMAIGNNLIVMTKKIVETQNKMISNLLTGIN